MRVIEVEDEHAEARFVAAEIAALVEDGHEPSRDRGRLPHERAEPRARGRARPAGRRLPGDRRAAVLRARRDQGRDRLPPGARQPVRRRLADADREPAAARRGRHVARAARRRSPTGSGISLWEALGRAEEAGLAAASLRAVQSFRDADPVADGGGAASCRRRRARRARARAHAATSSALEAERTIEARGRIENLEELVGVAREYEARGAEEPSLSQFLQEISLHSDQDALRDDDERRPGDADDAPQREGPRVPRRVHARDGGGDLPALALDRGELARGGAAALLRRHDAREGAADAARTRCGARSTAARDANLPSRFLDELPEEGVERERLAAGVVVGLRRAGAARARVRAARRTCPTSRRATPCATRRSAPGSSRGSSPAASSPCASRTAPSGG